MAIVLTGRGVCFLWLFSNDCILRDVEGGSPVMLLVHPGEQKTRGDTGRAGKGSVT